MTRNCTQAEITAAGFEPQYLKVGTGSSARHIAYLYHPSRAGGQQRPGIVRLARIRSDVRNRASIEARAQLRNLPSQPVEHRRTCRQCRFLAGAAGERAGKIFAAAERVLG